MSAPIGVEFYHYQCQLTDAELCRYGSPHVNKKEVYDELFPAIKERTPNSVFETDLQFQRSQILCANEVFPEAVSADPLQDLDIWHEWQQNIRRFPFPGLFSPLGIVKQQGKTTSTTSVGVLGEIMTGLFAQAYIAPWVIVRPIRRYPDFIYYVRDGNYAFVESKAFTGDMESNEHPLDNVPHGAMSECINNAVSQINADPFVTAWFSFTEICHINPLVLRVVFLELNASHDVRAERSRRHLPQAVIHGLAERALIIGAAKVSEELINNLADVTTKKRKADFRKMIADESTREIETIVQDSVPEQIVDDAINQIRKETQKLAMKANPDIEIQGQRLQAAKEMAAEGQIAELRQTGNDRLYLVDLTVEQRLVLERRWEPDWEGASEAWGTVSDTEFYRCSTAAVGLGPDGLQGREVEQN